MKHFNGEQIGKNVKILRETLGLTQLEFSNLTSIAIRTVANIESNKGRINIDTLSKILEFFSVDISMLNSSRMIIPEDFRTQIIKYHLKNKSENLHLLNKVPTIVFAIENHLIKSTFLDSPKEIYEIKDYFKTLGWNFIGSSISNALRRMPDLIEIRKHESKGNTNVYLKKMNN